MASDLPLPSPSGLPSETTYFIFTAAGRRLALPLLQVERVVRAVEITPLPQPQPGFAGIINVHGEIVPVIALHYWLQDMTRAPLTEVQETAPSAEQPEIRDHFVLVQHEAEVLALWAESMESVVSIPGADRVLAPDPLAAPDALRWYLLKTSDGMILEVDLAALLASIPSDWRQALPADVVEDVVQE